MENNDNPYADIIHLPHHVSKIYPQMPMANRAAQFSPFAALGGHRAAIREAARRTEAKRELGEYDREILDRKLGILRERQGSRPEISVTYFRPDTKKEGGAYVTASGRLEKIDYYEGMLVLSDGKKIYFEDISDIAGNWLAQIFPE